MQRVHCVDKKLFVLLATFTPGRKLWKIIIYPNQVCLTDSTGDTFTWKITIKWFFLLSFLLQKPLKCVQSTFKSSFPLPPWSQSPPCFLFHHLSVFACFAGVHYIGHVFVPRSHSCSSSGLLEQSMASPLSLSLLGIIGDQLSPNESSLLPSTSPSSSPLLCLQ